MRILVTAGPTREYFDSVRFISNPSTGKMGYAIAAAAARRGHSVMLVSGPVSLVGPDGVDMVQVVSAQEMLDAVVAHFEDCDCVIMTAAVCDYRPAHRLPHKFKKQDEERSVRLIPTVDILSHIAARKGGRTVIGFAMEDHDHKAGAEAKLARKGCDAIVLNDLANVGANGGAVQILSAGCGWAGPVSGTKQELASIVVDLAESLREGRPQ
jgi:phosphopantothenoylcysteine decarboxylase/phosphopantothenate--cysteine ligase